MNEIRMLAALVLALGAAPPPPPADQALEIMREVERRIATDSETHDGAIEVVDARGKVLDKKWTLWREGKRGRSRMLVRFSAPPEVRGVGLLSLNRPDGPAEQWLYTPAIRRDRRIAPQEKSQRFLGTDFSHEDMEERSIESYAYALAGEEAYGGHPAWKIRAVYNKPSDTQYSQLYLWVRKDIVATTFMEMYVGGKLRKTLLWDEWKQVQGIWTTHRIEMKDLERGSATRIRTSNVRYNARFEPDWFSLRNLRKVP